MAMEPDLTLEQLNALLPGAHFTPGWNKTAPSLWAEPRTRFQPRHWRYEAGRAALCRAGTLISTELAERRNLLMFDGEDGREYATTRTIVAAYQMLRPGEHARAHRHSPNALRLVLEGSSHVRTVVDGAALPMAASSVLLTPGNCWHSHFNEGDADAYWIDLLDVPLVHQLEPMFFEAYEPEYQEVSASPDADPMLICAATIERLLEANLPDASGLRSAVLPTPSLKTLAVSVIRFGDGASEWRIKESTNSIFAVMRGQGAMRAGALEARWKFGDVLSLPMWTEGTLVAEPGAMVLRVSDEPVMRALGLYRAG